MTDRFQPAAQVVKASHRALEEQRAQNMAAQRLAAAEAEAQVRKLGLVGVDGSSGNGGSGNGGRERTMSKEASCNSVGLKGPEEKSPPKVAAAGEGGEKEEGEEEGAEAVRLEKEADAVLELQNLILGKYAAILGAFRHYSMTNGRNPYALSVQTWLMLARDAKLDE